MSRFTLAPAVRADLGEIWDYVGIRNQRPDAAYRQVERLYDAFAFLASEPLAGELRIDLADRVRAFVVRPYLVLYTPESYGVRVIQVIHSARDIYKAFREDRLN